MVRGKWGLYPSRQRGGGDGEVGAKEEIEEKSVFASSDKIIVISFKVAR